MVELEAITVTGLRLDDNSPYNTYNRPNAEFSMTFGIEVLADGRLTAGKSSPGVTGRHSPEEALRQILAGTGLEARSTPSGTMTIEPAPEAGPEPEHLAQATPPPELELVILPEITVTASPLDDTSYNPPNATTATKTDTPIMETPVNIQVVPQQVLKDQQVIRLDDALRNVSGVIAHGTGFFDGAESFNIRGFQDFQVFRDGIQSGGRAHGAEETAHLERIEVLKGPAAILYGRIEPGGLINQVSKQPLAAPFYSLAQQFGSFDFYRTTVDAGGPINGDHSLKYRFNLAYEDAGSFVDFIENDRIFVAPVVRWDVSPATQITLQLQYKEGSDPLNPGIPFIGDRPAPVSRDTFLGEPGFGTDHREVYAGFHWSHAFNDDWTLSHRFIANPGRTDARPIFFQAIDGSRVARFLHDQRSADDSYDTTMNSLLGRPVAVRWTALDPSATNLALGYLDRAASVTEALDVINVAGGPPLNALVVDEAGSIGWTQSGRIPLRSGFDGYVAGSSGDGMRQWKSYIAPDDLPRVINPPSGFLVNANQRMIGAEYRYVIGHNFGGGYRAHRITERLRAMQAVTERDMLDIQLDTQTDFYRFYQRVALQALSAKGVEDREDLAAIRKYLEAWNGRADKESLGLPLLIMFRDILADAVFAPLLAQCRALDPKFEYGWATIDVPLQQLVGARLPELMPDRQSYADWNAFLMAMLENSVHLLLNEYHIASLYDLTWGQVNVTEISHPLGGAVPFIGRWLNMPMEPVSGCDQCVRVAGGSGGATERLVTSPKHPDEGILHMPGGQSGHPLSPFYRDQHAAWIEGRPTAFLAGETQHRLRLEPADVDPPNGLTLGGAPE